MDVKKFDLLLKRVNIEVDASIKEKMLEVISKYLETLSADNAGEVSLETVTADEQSEEAVLEHAAEVKEEAVVEPFEENQTNPISHCRRAADTVSS